MRKVVVLLAMMLVTVYTGAKESKKIKPEDPVEKHFYFRAGAGYAFPNAGQSKFSGSSQTSVVTGSVSTVTTIKVKPSSFSAGFGGAVSGGYLISNHIGVELNVNIGIANVRYTYVDERVNPAGTNVRVKSTSYAKMPIFLVPAIVIQSGGTKLNVYTRCGVVLPVKNKIVLETENSSTYNIEARTEELTTRFRVGFNGAIGVSHAITESISIWGEVSLLSFAPYLKESNVTKYTVNGVDNLPLMSQQDKVTRYEFSASVINSYSTNSPAVAQTFSVPYSNIGVAAGVSFSID